MNRFAFACVAAVASLVCSLPGCSSNSADGEAVLRAANSSNVQRLTNLYAAFSRQNRGRGPKDESEFRAFITAMGPERLERMGIKADAIDALFSSERDSQPLVIRYDRKASDEPAAGLLAKYAGAVVLEAKGAGGTRQAGFIDARGSREVKSLDLNDAGSGK